MKVAMIVSEMEPFAKIGGLADVAGALPIALGKLGVKVHLFLPRYPSIRTRADQVQIEPGVKVHFITHRRFFHRPGIYGNAQGDYPDNLERFSYLTQGSLRLMRQMHLRPDLLHAHDWHSALSVVQLATELKQDPEFAGTRSVLTIHNLAYQGCFPKRRYQALKLPGVLLKSSRRKRSCVSLLEGGLRFAQGLTTVSPTYAREIQTDRQGEGLASLLVRRRRALVGILNGIDTDSWNPRTDRFLRARYGVNQWGLKAKNKAALQKQLGLALDPEAFLIGMVTRLVHQKGLDLLVEALSVLSKKKIQWAILGKGEGRIERMLSGAVKKHPSLKVQLNFDAKLAHRIYAGADAFLMSSRYEPCGLGQMIAMRYGTVPIVRNTGGLADTVTQASTQGARGKGFCFTPYRAGALARAITQAWVVYQAKPAWHRIQQRGMRTDFSWDRSAREYLGFYKRVMSKDKD